MPTTCSEVTDAQMVSPGEDRCPPDICHPTVHPRTATSHIDRGLRSTEICTLQPTGNKNKTSETTDSETPLKSDKLARAAGGRAHLCQYSLTEPVLLDGEMRTLELM